MKQNPPLKLVFFIKRTNSYRFLAPIIDIAISRGDDVTIWHDYSGNKDGKKGYLFPHLESSPFFENRDDNLKLEPIFKREVFYEKIISNSSVDFYFTLSPLDDTMFEVDQDILDAISGKWVIIGHGIDSFTELPRPNSLLMAEYKRIILFETTYNYFHGATWLDQFFPNVDFLTSPFTIIDFVGSTVMHKENLNLDKEKIRKKYQIPTNSDIVIYLPFPFLAHRFENRRFALQAAWSGVALDGANCLDNKLENHLRRMKCLRLIWKLYCLSQIARHRRALYWFCSGRSELYFFSKLNTFCKRNGLYLVVKPRKKFPFPSKLHDLSDCLLLDDESQQHPSAFQELLSLAKLTVGGLSHAVLESVYAGVPYLNLEIPIDDKETPIERHWYDYTEQSIFNFPGVSTSVSVESIKNFPWPNTLLEFSSTAREHYLKKYLTVENSEPSRRVFDVLLRHSKRSIGCP